MSDLSITLEVGGETVTKNVAFSTVRGVRFLDDLILHFEEVDDGAGGTRPMTRTEVGVHYVTVLLKGQIQWAKGLEQNRLDGEVLVATDLEEN